jgi:hypothetical protein
MKTLLLLSLLLPSEEDNLIIVHGKRSESSHRERGGQSLLIQPHDEASRYETVTHLKRESSVLLPETGRISASGFVLPKIRGQDVRLTDVYLEDMKIQDPYSGLPLIEDLDLRAFGRLEVHQGMSPPDVPGGNPIGTIRYRFRQEKQSNLRLGLQSGRPFGESLWGLGVARDTDSDARLYLRGHRTSGRYAYYSDESTPYNVSDDRMRVRENNDQKSLQAVPYIKRQWNEYTLQGLGWIYAADRALPSNSALHDATARESSKGQVLHLSLRRDLQETALFTAAHYSLGLAQQQDDRKIEDPGHRYLGAAERTHMQVRSQHVNGSFKASGDSWDHFLTVDTSQSQVDNQADARQISDLTRHNRSLALGSHINPLPFVFFEGKLAWLTLRDADAGRVENGFQQEEWDQRKSRRDSRSLGMSAAYIRSSWGLYLQYAEAQRLPSLLEEFGNGSTLRPNVSLRAEDIHHREAGFSLQGDDWSLSQAIYQDGTRDKIIFVPILASASKALNIRRTDVMGIDLRAQYRWKRSDFYLSASRLYPYDRTRAEKKILPGLPEKIFVFEFDQGFSEDTTIRWFARYRSEIYRDLGNSVQLPGAWIHDASADHKIRIGKAEWALGLSLRNVFDVRDIAIQAPDTAGNHGRTAFSDVAGYPLPGRQWIASINFATGY